MFQNQITRREALALAAAVPLAGAASTFAQPAAPAPHAPQVGLATLGFPDMTNQELAQELSTKGIRLIQLFLNQKDSRYWKYNGRSDLSTLTPDRAKAIGEAYRTAGVSIHSMGVYTNLIHPDEKERQANLAYFESMMKVGSAMGVHTFISEAGHYIPEGQEPAVPYHFQESVWKMMVGMGKELAQLAERNEATVLLEPFYRGFLGSAKRTRIFIEEVGSPRIRALLDPANILEINDLEEMFQQLSPYIDCMHAKDRKLHVDKGVPAGQGDLDYPKFVSLAARYVPKAPLVLEYVGPKDYLQALAHLQKALAARPAGQ
jgi:sugar phosphate isomerase/epimerase